MMKKYLIIIGSVFSLTAFGQQQPLQKTKEAFWFCHKKETIALELVPIHFFLFW